jgi:hypothetical protein
LYRYSEAFLISKLVAAAQADPDAGKDKEANKEVAAEMRRARATAVEALAVVGRCTSRIQLTHP